MKVAKDLTMWFVDSDVILWIKTPDRFSSLLLIHNSGRATMSLVRSLR